MSNDDEEEAQQEEEGQQMQNAVSAKISQNLNTVISSGNREDLEQVNARQTPTKTIFSSHANKLL